MNKHGFDISGDYVPDYILAEVEQDHLKILASTLSAIDYNMFVIEKIEDSISKWKGDYSSEATTRLNYRLKAVKRKRKEVESWL